METQNSHSFLSSSAFCDHAISEPDSTRIRVAAQSLPRESALQEVHKDVAERLQIVSATLLDPEMICNASVARSPCEVLVFTIPTDEEDGRQLRSVGLLIRVHVTFAQSEVD